MLHIIVAQIQSFFPIRPLYITSKHRNTFRLKTFNIYVAQNSKTFNIAIFKIQCSFLILVHKFLQDTLQRKSTPHPNSQSIGCSRAMIDGDGTRGCLPVHLRVKATLVLVEPWTVPEKPLIQRLLELAMLTLA